MDKTVRVLTVILVAVCLGCDRTSGGPPAGGSGEVALAWGGLGRTRGRFQKPRAIAASGERLYVVDTSGRIQVFDLDGNWKESWRLAETSRGYPTGLGIGPDGCLAVADTHNYVVRIYSPAGEVVKTIGREGGGRGEFTYLTDVEFSPEGQMYVSEHGREDRVQRFDREGRFLALWGSAGEGRGEFHRPQALAVDGDGCVYVADAANHRVQKFSSEGKVLAVWGEPGRGPGQLLYPYDLALGPDGLLLVCEYGNNRVQVFDSQGRSVKIIGRAGRGPGELSGPWAVSGVGGRGLYVVDTGNNRVQLFAEALCLASARSSR